MKDLVLLLANRGGATNLGDRLLQEVLRRSLQDRGVSMMFQDGAAGPAQRGRAARFRKPLFDHLALIDRALRARLGGNGHATVFLPPGQALTKPIAQLPRVAAQLLYLCLLKAFGVRVVSLGRGISLHSKVSRLQETGIARLADYYGLRDDASLRQARRIGARHAEWFPDLSWLLPVSPGVGPSPSPGRSTVVLCFRDLGERGRQESRVGGLHDAIAGLMDQAGALGLSDFECVCHDEADRYLMGMIQERHRGRHRVRCEPAVLSPADIPRIYGRAALVFTNRLHSLLLGLQWGAGGVALVDDARLGKIRTQLQDLGLGDQVVDVGTSGPPAGIVRSTLDRHGSVTRAVGAYREKAVMTAHRALASLFP